MNIQQETALPVQNNSQTPVSQLPAETLAEIFKLTQKGTKRELNKWYWIAITHVCRHWRNIATGTQELWTYINVNRHASMEQTVAYLERSGISPLVVRFYFSTNEPFERLCKTLEHLPRIRDLSIHVGLKETPNEIKHVEMLLTKPAPILHNLYISISRRDPMDVRSLFDGQTPRLRKLNLNTNALSWYDVPYMRNLTELSFGVFKSFSVYQETSPIHPQDLFLILKENPNLENLDITCGLILSKQEELPTISPSIELPDLKSFYISGSTYKALAHLIENVKFPSKFAWNLYCRDLVVENPDADPRRVVPSVSYNDEACKTLCLGISPDSLHIDADYGDEWEQWDQGVPLQRIMTYSFVHEDGRHEENLNITKVFDLVCSVIQGGFWCSATELTIMIATNNIDLKHDLLVCENLGFYHWVRLLQLFPNLRKLSVRRAETLEDTDWIVKELHAGLLGALVGYAYEDEEIGINYNLCQSLVELKLCGLDLDITTEVLAQVCRTRASKGMQLRSLELFEPFGLTERNHKVLIKEAMVADVIIVTNTSLGRYRNARKESQVDSDSENSENSEVWDGGEESEDEDELDA